MSQKFSNFAIELAAGLKKLGQNNLIKSFNDYYAYVTGKPASGMVDVFGGDVTEPLSQEDAILKAFEIKIDTTNKDNGNDNRSKASVVVAGTDTAGTER